MRKSPDDSVLLEKALDEIAQLQVAAILDADNPELLEKISLLLRRLAMLSRRKLYKRRASKRKP